MYYRGGSREELTLHPKSVAAAGRSYPASEVGVGAGRRHPESEVRGGGQEELPHV